MLVAALPQNEKETSGAPPRTKLRTLMSLRLQYNAAGAPRTAADVGELHFEGARSQNIENNPMQSSWRPPAFDKAI